MKRLEVFLLPLNGMLVHHRSISCNLLGFQQFACTHLYSWVERGTMRVKNTTQCPRPGLEPGPLTPGMSALTMRPPCLPVTSMPFPNTCFTWLICPKQDIEDDTVLLVCSLNKSFLSNTAPRSLTESAGTSSLPRRVRWKSGFHC